LGEGEALDGKGKAQEALPPRCAIVEVSANTLIPALLPLREKVS
jgi:hypothetical protein